MGLLSSVFGTPDTQSGTESAQNSYAVLLNAGPSDTPTAGNGFNYALELERAGHEVQVFLDGKGTKWPATFAEKPDHPFSKEWDRIQQRGLLAGACGYCANAFDVAEACDASGIELLSDADEHAPAVAELAAQDYEILTVG